MKTDRITKILLAVIAINLSILSLSSFDFFPKAAATDADFSESGVAYGLVPINEDGTISVKLSNYDEISVKITDISTSDILNVNLKDIGTSDLLNVNLKDISSYDMLDVNIAGIETTDELNVSLESVDTYAFRNCTVPVEIDN